jgi:hypothetical protein
VDAFRADQPVSTVLKNLPTDWTVGIVVVLASALLIAWAVWRSKSESAEMREIVGELEEAAAEPVGK